MVNPNEFVRMSSMDVLKAQQEAASLRRELQKRGIVADVCIRKRCNMKYWLIVTKLKDTTNVPTS